MSSVGAPGPVVARIDLGALRANWAVLRAAAGRARLFAVVKADAYGHGAPAVARTLRDAGCDAFAVARVSELAVLRDAGLEGEVLVLGGTVDAAEADAALALGATLALHHEEHVALAAAAARRRSVCAAVHLEVDTGMRRMGVCSDDLPRLVARVAAEPSLRLAGVFTHFARADEPGAPEADAQLARFSAALEAAKLPRDGSLLVHAANSAGILAGERLGAALPQANAARPGLALYGVSPFGTSDGRASALRPVMTLAARVVQTRRLARGDAVGYGSTWRAERPTTVATVAAGYADGVPWALGNRGAIALRGRRLPIVGRVSMDFVTVDAGDAPAALGDEAVLFGEAEAGAISASEVAAAAGTIPYEILSRVAPRVPRVLVSDGGPRRPA